MSDVVVIERAQIEQLNDRTLPELLARTAGIQMSANGGAGKQSSVFIRGTEARHTILLIDGVRCAACCWLIERTLDALPGVTGVSVNAGAQRARIVYDGRAVSLTRIVDALARVGYRALPLDRAALDEPTVAARREDLLD